MNFYNLINNRLTLQAKSKLAAELGSKTMLTRRSNQPEKASHKQLLIFAKYLALSPAQLYDQYAVGKDTLTDLQIKTLPDVV